MFLFQTLERWYNSRNPIDRKPNRPKTQSNEHACAPLPQRPSAANSYCNPRFAMRVHPPVPAFGVLNEKYKMKLVFGLFGRQCVEDETGNQNIVGSFYQ